jgi:hypothetical protein
LTRRQTTICAVDTGLTWPRHFRPRDPRQ